jgi:signal peptidase I
MGDHREASADSRSFGAIKQDTIVGRAFLRYWPASTFGILSRPDYP